MKNRFIIINASGKSLVALLLVCCTLTAGAGDKFSDNLKNLLVDDDWLMQRLGDDDLVIIDVRPRIEYFRGHIKGAVSLPVGDTFSKNTQLDRLAPATEIQALFGRAGIGDASHVVVYDGGQFRSAARVLWALHTYGHEKVSLLAVDFNTWESKDLPVSIYETLPRKKIFVPRIRPERLATAFQTLLSTKNKKVTIVDVRVPEEYRGEKSRSARYGHIPAAINVDWHELAITDGVGRKLKELDDLRDLFQEVPEGNKVITYCQKGHEAALAYIALRLLGYDVMVYDGSWFEWGNSTIYPVEGPDTHPATPE